MECVLKRGELQEYHFVNVFSIFEQLMFCDQKS